MDNSREQGKGTVDWMGRAFAGGGGGIFLNAGEKRHIFVTIFLID
jgi:hypothetical protein